MVTLVGVWRRIRRCHLPDWRSVERHVPAGAAGGRRAGRDERPGRVIVQTYDPAITASRRRPPGLRSVLQPGKESRKPRCIRPLRSSSGLVYTSEDARCAAWTLMTPSADAERAAGAPEWARRYCAWIVRPRDGAAPGPLREQLLLKSIRALRRTTRPRAQPIAKNPATVQWYRWKMNPASMLYRKCRGVMKLAYGHTDRKKSMLRRVSRRDGI